MPSSWSKEYTPQPKPFIAYPGGRHNDLRLHGAGIDAIRFLNDLPPTE